MNSGNINFNSFGIPHKYILSNDLRLILIPRHKKGESVTVAMFVNAGSNNETKKNNGIAHYLEHLMFKGTKNRPNLSLIKELDSMGVSYNAMTGKEFTCYYASGFKKDCKNIIDIIIDMYSNSSFSLDSIEKERGVILEELNMGKNDPSEKLFSKMHSKIFWNTAMGMDTIGTIDNIKNLHREDFIEFKKKFYTPKNSIMVVSGDFDADTIKSTIKTKFKKVKTEWKSLNETSVTNLNCHLNQNKPYIYLKNMKLAQSQVLFAFRTIPNARSMDVLSDVLTTGLSSRLVVALRQNLGATYSISSGYIGYKNDGILFIMFGIANDRIYESIAVILSELTKLKKGISEEEIKRANKQRQTSFLLSLQTTKSVNLFYGLNELDQPFEDFLTDKKENIIKTVYEKYKNTNKEDLKYLVDSTFTSNNFNLFVYGNTKDIKKNMKKLEEKINNLNY